MSALKITLASAALLLVAAGGYHAVTAISLSQDVATLRSEVAVLQTTLESEELETEELATLTEEAEATLALRGEVVAAREIFVATVATAEAAFASAADKVDVTALRQQVLDAQEAVRGVLDDPATVTTQTEAVKAGGDEATAQVKAHDERVAEEQRRAAPPAPRSNLSVPPSSGGGGWFEDARARLNAAGGSHIHLYEYDGNCSGRQSPACAYDGIGIAVHSSFASMSPERRSWSMTHELAHHYQFAVWKTLLNSSGFSNLFGGDLELLANCMASARGYSNHGHAAQCSTERIDYGRSIWNGSVPW